MRWAMLAGVFFSLAGSVLSADSDEPSLKILSRILVYNVGEDKGIYCEGTNVPDQIEWKSPTGEVVQRRSAKNTRVYVERPSKNPNLAGLIIHKMRLSDAGNWTCEAGDISKTIPILIGKKVEMDRDTQDVQADEGKNHRLSCEAKGSPTPNVQWYKEETLISEDDPKYVITRKEDTYMLEIKRLTREDSGLYTCKVTQNTLSHYTHKSFHLRVHHKPILFNPRTNDPYEILSSGNKARTEEIFALLDDTKNITCIALAYPPAKFAWYRRKKAHDTPIHDVSMISEDNNSSSTLMLRLRDEEDLGQYRCTASNDKGAMTIIYDVNLGKKPWTPENVTLHSTNSTHLTFNVTCGDNCTFSDNTEAVEVNNLPITAYEFQVVPVEPGYNTADWDNSTSFRVEIEDPEDTLFEVGPLPKKTEFQVRVRCENLAGFSDWLLLSENLSTTDHAIKLAATLLLVVISFFITIFI